MLHLPKDAKGNVLKNVPLLVWQIGGGEYDKDMMTVATANRCLVSLAKEGIPCAALVFAIANPNYHYSASLFPEKIERIDRNNALQMAFIDTLIADGTVDGSRLFCAGASSGGGCTMRFMMQFANRFKGAIPCCAMDPIVPIHKVEEKYPGQFTDDVEKFRKWLGNSYDVIIVGSDAVWNYSKRGLPNPYFLDDIPGIHMSYAASCNGLDIDDFSEIGEKDRDFLRKVLSNFTYIGVRDEQTEAFVRSILPGKETHLNCDPSFFANDLSDENRIVLQDRLENLYGLSPDKPVVGLMLSNHNGTFTKDFIDRLHSGYGDRFQTAAIYSYNRYADIPYMADLQPREWSRVFGLFDITISKYFHGTLFSLLNHTPVMSIGAEKNIGKYPNKVESVLGSMGLDELYFPAKKGEDINWDRFFDTFDHLINDDITLRIENGIKNEQKKAESFFRKLDVILGNKK